MNGNALGLIETMGLVGLISAVDAMLKAAIGRGCQLDHQARRRGRQRDGPRRCQQRPRRRRGGRRGRRQDRRAPRRPCHPSPGRRRGPSVRGRSGTVKILVANLGSTSFKYRLFDVSDPAEPVLARGRSSGSAPRRPRLSSSRSKGEREMVRPIADHGDAVQLCLDQLTDPEIGVLADASDVSAIGFKAVHARNLTGVHLVDDHVLEAMEAFADVAPAHNPPYTRAMRMLRERFPRLPLVAAFETGFHRTVPEANQRVCDPRSLGDRAGHPAVGVSWRQPSLHLMADARASGTIRHPGDFLPPGRQLVALRHQERPVRGVQPGHEPAVRPAAQQPGRRFRRLRPAGPAPGDRQEPGGDPRYPGQSLGPRGAVLGSRPPRHRGGRGRRRLAGQPGDRRLHRLDPPLPGRLPARAGRAPMPSSSRAESARTRRRSARASATISAGSASASTPSSTRLARPNGGSHPSGSRVAVWTVPTNEELVVARQSKALLDSGQKSMD